ncbi:MAG: ABC transporter permease, partial [Planctomycetota bacterium]
MNTKAVRDVWHMRGQVLAICLVMGCGVATFIMSLSTLRSLERTLDAYYERYRFAEVFAHLKRAPQTLADRIAEIPGVAQVQTRVVQSVTLDMPGMSEPAVGRLISLPPGVAPALNDLYLRRGGPPRSRSRLEVMASEAFADAHGLEPGDSIQAILNGRLEDLAVTGVVLSPEYIYQIREGDVLPDERRFGVLWMNQEELAAAFDMEGAFNDVSLTLMHGATEAEVIARLDRLIEPYGGLGAYARED